MSLYVFVNPANPKQKLYTSNPQDPAVPTGWVQTNTSDGSWQGVDGQHDQDLQVYQGGLASGGFPSYYGYSDGLSSNKNPNGILGG